MGHPLSRSSAFAFLLRLLLAVTFPPSAHACTGVHKGDWLPGTTTENTPCSVEGSVIINGDLPSGYTFLGLVNVTGDFKTADVCTTQIDTLTHQYSHANSHAPTVRKYARESARAYTCMHLQIFKALSHKSTRYLFTRMHAYTKITIITDYTINYSLANTDQRHVLSYRAKPQYILFYTSPLSTTLLHRRTTMQLYT